MKNDQLVFEPSSVFVWKYSDHYKRNQLFVNPDLPDYHLEPQESAQLLVSTCEHWKKQVTEVYCNCEAVHNCPRSSTNPGEVLSDTTELEVSCWHEKDGRMSEGSLLLSKLFGSSDTFSNLPFVNQRRYGVSSFSFGDLKLFADKGTEGIEQKHSEEKRLKEEKKARERQERDEKSQKEEAEWVSLFSTLTPSLQSQLQGRKTKGDLVIVGNNTALLIGHRSEYGSSGGIGYWSQVTCFCGSQKQMQEWQWRDRYSASNDQSWLSVHGIGNVESTDENCKKIIAVELLNRDYGSRSATFTFDQPTSVQVARFSAEDQTAFTKKVEAELAQVMDRLNELHGHKPQMITARGHANYYQPRVKQQEIHADVGVAAFVVEEQIDHHGDDRQMRCNLYVLKHGWERAKLKAEDHGYDKREGGAFLQIIETSQASITINTKSGKTVISFS